MKNECQCGTNEQVSTSLNKFKPAQTQQQKQQQHGAAVKLILWPSGETGNSSVSDVGLKNNNISDKTSSAVNSASMDQINKKTSRNKMWSKLPLRQIPSSLSAKMGWLGQILIIMIYLLYYIFSPHIFEVHYYLVQN